MTKAVATKKEPLMSLQKHKFKAGYWQGEEIFLLPDHLCFRARISRSIRGRLGSIDHRVRDFYDKVAGKEVTVVGFCKKYSANQNILVLGITTKPSLEPEACITAGLLEGCFEHLNAALSRLKVV